MLDPLPGTKKVNVQGVYFAYRPKRVFASWVGPQLSVSFCIKKVKESQSFKGGSLRQEIFMYLEKARVRWLFPQLSRLQGIFSRIAKINNSEDFRTWKEPCNNKQRKISNIFLCPGPKFPVTWWIKWLTHLGFLCQWKKLTETFDVFSRPCLRLCLGKVWAMMLAFGFRRFRG